MVARAFIWTYLHMPLVLSIVALGSGTLNVVLAPESISSSMRVLVSLAGGSTLILVAAVESFSHRDDDELTHPLVSPLLKVTSGLAVIVIGLSFESSAIFLLALIFAAQVVHMVYGAIKWFTQEVAEDREDRYVG